MNENEMDMSELLQKFGSMLNGADVPDELKHMMEQFSSSGTSSSATSGSSSFSASSTSAGSDDFSFPDIDLDMMLKLKRVMDSMKSTKVDARSNLLTSLKPYLRESRREKVDQYIRLFRMAQAFELLNGLGGDDKSGSK